MTSLATLLSCAIDVERLATHDRLTGLYNWPLFDDHLMVELARARRNGLMLALIYLDLDQFNPVKDTSSQEIVDELRANVGLRLRSTIRSGDTAARIGEDQFALILPDIHSLDSATRVAQALLESLQDPIRFTDNVFTMTASIGVAVYPRHGQSPEALMACAEMAMYAAKAEGGNRFCLGSDGNNVDSSDPSQDRPLLRVLLNPSDLEK